MRHKSSPFAVFLASLPLSLPRSNHDQAAMAAGHGSGKFGHAREIADEMD